MRNDIPISQSASEMTASVLKSVGARPWDRDAVDQRLVEEARNGGGRIIDDESDVGGYRVLGKR